VSSPSRARRLTIASKLGVVMGAMTLVAAVVAGVLFVQLRQVTTTYDELLTSQVQSALQAREMQVTLKKQVQEWKDILLRGFTPADLATYTKQFHDRSAKVDDLGRALLANLTDGDARVQVQTFLDEHATLNRNYEAAYAAFVAAGAEDPRVPDKAVRGQDRPPTDRIDGIVARLQGAVTDRTAQQAAAVAGQQSLLAIVAGAALLAMVAALIFVVAGIVRPIRALTRAAYQAARTTLPEAIEQIGRSAPDAPRPRLPEIDVRSGDELRDLADALTSLQESSVDLAMLQHKAERQAADMLVNLGRRNQSLLKRTLGYVTDLEEQETDPDVLAKLFRLDHATTRIRRNAESMLVLAGAEQTRTWSRPVQIADAVRAALSEIEDYTRVDLHHVEPAALVGNAVADVVHLVAELTENAASFSPPTSRVTIVGQVVPDGYRLRIIDTGVGMTQAELDGANARIARAADGRADSPLLGFYVIGRLAARRGITVELEPSAGRGITATVLVPPVLLADPAGGADEPEPAPGGPSRADAGAPAPMVGGRGLDRRARIPATDPQGVAAVRMRADAGAGPPSRIGAADRVPVAAVPEQRSPSGSGIGAPDTAPFTTSTGWFDFPATGPAEPGDDEAPAAPAATGQAIPRRVRGAQLPDMAGAGHAAGDYAAPDPGEVLRQLGALAAGHARAQQDRERDGAGSHHRRDGGPRRNGRGD
jgi:signal transduction histidine kinase